MEILSGSPLKRGGRFLARVVARGFATVFATGVVLIAASGLWLTGCNGVVNTTTTSNGSNSGSGAATAPAITTQPASQTVGVGQAATFVVVANGSTPLRYQWQKTASAFRARPRVHTRLQPQPARITRRNSLSW